MVSARHMNIGPNPILSVCSDVLSEYSNLLTEPVNNGTEHLNMPTEDVNMMTEHRNMPTELVNMETEHRNMPTERQNIFPGYHDYPSCVRCTLNRDGVFGEAVSSRRVPSF